MSKRDDFRVSLRIDKDAHRVASELAASRGQTFSDFVRNAIDERVNATDKFAQLESSLQAELLAIHDTLHKHTELLYAAISASAMVSAMTLKQEPQESDQGFKKRKHRRLEQTVFDAVGLGKWLVDGYPKFEQEFGKQDRIG